jgi:anthranilate synthase component 1
LARYSFIGVQPRKAFVLRGQTLAIHQDGEINLQTVTDPLSMLAAELADMHRFPMPGLPRFSGGLAGYLGYEMMRFFEPSVNLQSHETLPDAIFLLADTVIAFDHAFGTLMLIATPRSDLDQQAAQAEANARLDAIQQQIAAPLPPASPANVQPGEAKPSQEMQTNMSAAQYMHAVEQAKQHIAAGDIFQVVLSQRLSRETQALPFDIYRALRRLNPSPYMFYFDFADLAGDEPMVLIGASPEMHVRYEQGTAALRPIAGTRPRGKSAEEDNFLADDLMADPKERAEHVMLVDLARNDLGRVCDYGSVHVPELMQVERYSHVMHIVSKVEGLLRSEMDAFALMKATFPAGTVSGAPKIRAMQIIDRLEAQQRGPYAGAVGYFGADGSMDTCIAIRTLVMCGKQISVQAGAGIVADSDPESEYQETLNKARALAVAVEMAEQDLA